MLDNLYLIYDKFSSLLIVIVTWAWWSARQKFVTRKEFDEYKEVMNKKTIQQNIDIAEIKVELKHISKNIDEIKESIKEIS